MTARFQSGDFVRVIADSTVQGRIASVFLNQGRPQYYIEMVVCFKKEYQTTEAQNCRWEEHQLELAQIPKGWKTPTAYMSVAKQN